MEMNTDMAILNLSLQSSGFGAQIVNETLDLMKGGNSTPQMMDVQTQERIMNVVVEGMGSSVDTFI